MEKQMFKGVSDAGDFQLALSNAIDNALQSSDVADDKVKWTLYEVNGEKGGLHGINMITVTIQAQLASNQTEE